MTKNQEQGLVAKTIMLTTMQRDKVARMAKKKGESGNTIIRKLIEDAKE